MNIDPMKLRIAAASGFLAVALGAMGAHGLKGHWESTLALAEAAKHVETWKTASLYHIVHSVVMLVLAFAFTERSQGRWAFLLFCGGIVFFSGSLYALCLGGGKWLGPVTPLGGVMLMAGWVLTAFRK